MGGGVDGILHAAEYSAPVLRVVDEPFRQGGISVLPGDGASGAAAAFLLQVLDQRRNGGARQFGGVRGGNREIRVEGTSEMQ